MVLVTFSIFGSYSALLYSNFAKRTGLFVTPFAMSTWNMCASCQTQLLFEMVKQHAQKYLIKEF